MSDEQELVGLADRVTKLETHLASLAADIAQLATLRADIEQLRRELEEHLITCPGTRGEPSAPS